MRFGWLTTALVALSAVPTAEATRREYSITILGSDNQQVANFSYFAWGDPNPNYWVDLHSYPLDKGCGLGGGAECYFYTGIAYTQVPNPAYPSQMFDTVSARGVIKISDFDYKGFHFLLLFPLGAANSYGTFESLAASGFDRGIMTISLGVPEPATWALMILGFGAVGGALRRQGAKRARGGESLA